MADEDTENPAIKKMREHILNIFQAGLRDMAPDKAIYRHVKCSGSTLLICQGCA